MDVAGSKLTPRQKLILSLPLIAAAVLVLVYFQLFSNPLVIVVIFISYVAVSIWNKRRFDRQRSQNKG